MKHKYNLYIAGWFEGIYFSTNDEKEMWDEIGKLTFGSGYEVLDADGNHVKEFIPF